VLSVSAGAFLLEQVAVKGYLHSNAGSSPQSRSARHMGIPPLLLGHWQSWPMWTTPRSPTPLPPELLTLTRTGGGADLGAAEGPLCGPGGGVAREVDEAGGFTLLPDPASSGSDSLRGGCLVEGASGGGVLPLLGRGGASGGCA
jgi:hypothetical protein